MFEAPPFDPSEWIKNTTISVGEGPKFVITFVNGEGLEAYTYIQKLVVDPEATVWTDEDSALLEEHVNKACKQAFHKKEDNIKAVMLMALAPNMTLGNKFMGAVADIPEEWGFQTLYVVVSDGKQWIDYQQDTAGDVQEDIVTVFQLENLMERQEPERIYFD